VCNDDKGVIHDLLEMPFLKRIVAEKVRKIKVERPYSPVHYVQVMCKENGGAEFYFR
jgi:hypothetical protein